MNSMIHTLILIAVAAIVTFLLRAMPFFVFNGKRQMSPRIKKIADGLPPAIITVLVVYCIKDQITLLNYSLLASLISIVVVVLVHVWKKNTLISIAVGTLLYMFLIRILI